MKLLGVLLIIGAAETIKITFESKTILKSCLDSVNASTRP